MTSYSLLAFHLFAQLGGERGTVKDEDRRDVVVQQQAQASHAELDVPERERKRLGREIEDRESRKGSVRQRAAARQRRGEKREREERRDVERHWERDRETDRKADTQVGERERDRQEMTARER
jgi:hypothetical protein